MMTKKEILDLIEEDLNNEGIPVLDIEIIDYKEVLKTIESIEIKICNLYRIEDNVAFYIKERLDVFTEETGIKIEKKLLVL